MRTEGQRKVTIERVKNTEDWKAVRGYWHGTKKVNGWSGCGVVIQAVDRDRWITFNKLQYR